MDDVQLARAVGEGDGLAFSEMFDRYAPQVHDLALALLRDRRVAAEVVEATFTEARQRLPGLQEPHRLGVWLLAVARRNVARRAGPTAGLDRRPTLAGEDQERDRLTILMWEAVADLPLRDRTLIDLSLRQGLAGHDLASALGVDLDQLHALEANLRGPIDKGLAGYLVDRSTQGRCPELTKALRGWDGRFTDEGSALLAGHVEGCAVCETCRFELPSPFALYADALPAHLPPSAQPRDLERLVLRVPLVGDAPTAPTAPTASTDLVSPGGLPEPELPVLEVAEVAEVAEVEPWLPDGFPPPSFNLDTGTVRTLATPRGRWLLTAALLGALLIVAGLVVAAQGGDDRTALSTGLGTTRPSVPVTETTFPSFTPSTDLDPTALDPEATTPPATLPAPSAGTTAAPATTATTATPTPVPPPAPPAPPPGPGRPTPPGTPPTTMPENSTTTAPPPSPPTISPVEAGGRYGPAPPATCTGPWMARARVNDLDGVGSVRADSSGNPSEMTRSPATDIWEVLLPQQNAGTIVNLTIRAIDARGAEAVTPVEQYICT